MTGRLRTLALLPLGLALLFLAAVAIAPDAARGGVVRTAIEAAKSMAVIGALAAAFAFQRGDHLRRAWLLLAACAALLLLRDATLIPAVGSRWPEWIPWVRAGLAVVANLCGVLGTWLLATAWSIAGVELPGSRLSRRGVLLGAALIAIAIAGPATWLRLREASAGDPRGVTMLASGLADAIQLILLAPVLLTALALRGGLLSWTWGLLAGSLLAWLFYDALSGYGDLLLAGGGLWILAATESFRVIAGGFGLTAGLAQRMVVLAARQSSGPP